MTKHDALIYLCKISNFDFKLTMDLIHEDYQIPSDAFVDKELSDSLVTPLDDEYPERLRHIFSMPLTIHRDDIKFCGKILLVGKNKFNLPEGSYFTVEQLHSDVLTSKPENVSSGLCSCCVITEKIPFGSILPRFLLDNFKNIYVVPTSKPSLNNELIKSDCYLLDSKSCLEKEIKKASKH